MVFLCEEAGWWLQADPALAPASSVDAGTFC